MVRFPQFIAWQVVDESFTGADQYEVRDDAKHLQSLLRSRYLDFVKAHHGWFEPIAGPATHYRIWTEDAVIDVIACQPPVVEPWK